MVRLPTLRKKSKIALVLMGGGIMGAAWEIGCLTALDRLMRGRYASHQLDLYVGISAGSVIAALLANRVPPALIYERIVQNQNGPFNFSHSDIYRLDKKQLLLAAFRTGSRMFRTLRNFYRRQKSLGLSDIFYILQEQLPSGVYSLQPLQDYLCRSFRQEGLIDHFEQLEPQLLIPAIDIDLGCRVVFGRDSNISRHLCQAITASCAIPCFFQPVRIGEHHYIDGSTGLAGHVDLAIEQGADLVLVINPRIPINNDRQKSCLPSLSTGKCESIANLGISFVWEQSERIEGHRRLQLELDLLRKSHTKTDILLFEPRNDDPLHFLQSPMSFDARNLVMTSAYHSTLAHLRDNFAALSRILHRHGCPVSQRHLEDPPPGM